MEALPYATQIVQTLRDAGHTAYFAGGWVRDFLRDHPSDDIDIATSASPDEVISIFPKTVEVGKAFGVIVVLVKNHQFEVASFRKEGLYLDGRKPESIEPAAPEEDAHRRDFTINGMFYDPIEKVVLDYVEGQADLQKGIIRAIGNPNERFVEDRLRMIRAVRFSARFDFPIEEATAEAIRTSASSLYPSVSVERVWQELSRMTQHRGIQKAIMMLLDFGLLREIFPELEGVSREELEELIQPLDQLELTTPPILVIAHLFPHYPAPPIFERLRVSGREKKLVEYFETVRDAQNLDRVEWVRIYARSQAEIVFDALAPLKGPQFKEEHDARKKQLAPHIDRMRRQEPLVTSDHLTSLGVVPGPAMGQWLRYAERVAVDKDLHSVEAVLVHVKEAMHV